MILYTNFIIDKYTEQWQNLITVTATHFLFKPKHKRKSAKCNFSTSYYPQNGSTMRGGKFLWTTKRKLLLKRS